VVTKTALRFSEIPQTNAPSLYRAFVESYHVLPAE
jgi:hypothetical protein